MNEELLKSFVEAKKKVVNGLKTDIQRQRKELRTSISNLCIECGYYKERYLSPCKECEYYKLKNAL